MVRYTLSQESLGHYVVNTSASDNVSDGTLYPEPREFGTYVAITSASDNVGADSEPTGHLH